VKVSVTVNPSWSSTNTVIVVVPNCPVTGVKVISLVAPTPVIVI